MFIGTNTNIGLYKQNRGTVTVTQHPVRGI